MLPDWMVLDRRVPDRMVPEVPAHSVGQGSIPVVKVVPWVRDVPAGPNRD